MTSNKKAVLSILFVCVTLFLASCEPGIPAGSEDEINKRIRPIAREDIQEADEVVALAGGKGGAINGKEVFDKTCSACHSTGLAGAPKLGDKAAWQPRIDKGMNSLMHSVMNGKGAMPPRGTTNLSEPELRVVVQYMISKVK